MIFNLNFMLSNAKMANSKAEWLNLNDLKLRGNWEKQVYAVGKLITNSYTNIHKYTIHTDACSHTLTHSSHTTPAHRLKVFTRKAH